MLRYFVIAGTAAASFAAAILLNGGRLVMLPLAPAAAADDKSATANGIVMFGHDPTRNMVNATDKNLPDDWDVRQNTNIKWVAKLGTRAYGGPTISGGKVYVGTNNYGPRNQRDTRLRKDGKREPIDKGILMCFDEATGNFLWQHVNEKLPSGQVNDWPHEGVCSTPTVESDRVYYVSNRCDVVCLDANGFANGNQGVQDEQYKEPTDADVIWRYDMMKELNVFPHNLAACSPLLVGNTLFVVTANGVDEGHINIPSPDAPSFIALDKTTGKLIWKSSLPGRNIMHGQWSNPSYAVFGGVPTVVYPGGDGWIYGLKPETGEMIWKFDANPKDAEYKLGSEGTKSDFIATPVIHDGKIYIGTGQDPEHFEGVGHLWCFNPAGKTGDISAELVTDAAAKPPKTKPNPNSAVAWHYGGPKPNPAPTERGYFFGRTMCTCAIHDGLCYACDLAGILVCLDAQTGKKYWDFDMKGQVWGSPYWMDGKVYIGTEDGDVFIFTHGKQFAEPKKVEMGKPIRSTIVAANGVVYVMTESHLYAIQKKN
jgi:outer membrane protein assembly factor BamB